MIFDFAIRAFRYVIASAFCHKMQRKQRGLLSGKTASTCDMAGCGLFILGYELSKVACLTRSALIRLRELWRYARESVSKKAGKAPFAERYADRNRLLDKNR